MTCQQIGVAHVCAPRGERFVHSGTCLDCGQWTRFIGVQYLWYGVDQCCLKCGRRWSDGEWMPLHFEPQSRQNSIKRMKEAFRRAGGPGTLQRQIDREMSAHDEQKVCAPNEHNYTQQGYGLRCTKCGDMV